MKKQWNKFTSFDEFKELELENVLVLLDKELFGSKVQVLNWANSNVPVVCGRFYYDASKIVAWSLLDVPEYTE